MGVIIFIAYIFIFYMLLLGGISDGAPRRGYWYIRCIVAWALGKIGDSKAIESLIKALWDDDWKIQGKAAEALGRIGDPKAVEPLIEALDDSNSYVKKKSVEALGRIGDPKAVEPLIRAVGDRDSDVRKNAAEALGRIGDPKAIEPLIRVLGNSDWHLQEKAKEALVKIGSPAIEPLIRALGDSNSDLRENAREALEKICSQITMLTFGQITTNHQRTTWNNPDLSKLTLGMRNLTKILIDAETYNSTQLEQFITYALKFIGTKHLKEKVEVYIYNNPEKLHPNLMNSFKNNFKMVS